MENTYKILEWPDSKEVVGNSDCIMLSPHQKDVEAPAYFVPSDLYFEIKSRNKEVSEIKKMYESQYCFMEQLIRESIRKYISRTLMDTSEESPFDCKICIQPKEGFGLSTLNYPWITKIWQDPTEGIIYFVYDGDTENALEFDLMLLEDLIIVCDYLDNL